MDSLEDCSRNLTMLTDFYEITMANGYFEKGFKNKIAVFDLFFRHNPDNGGFSIMSGVYEMFSYLKNLKFSNEDIEYLRDKNTFNEEFLMYLKDFKFSCDVWCVREGTPVFPREPLVTIKGPLIEAQLVETMLLLCVNHQSLITTKAYRIVSAAQGRAVMEFGARRAQSFDAAVIGARNAYIAGCSATSCTITDRNFGVPVSGTMAHSWVQMFDSEYEAFKAYAEIYPASCTLLVDTYNVLKSGIHNAIKVFDNVLKPLGYRPCGIRIDSGDITYLSRKSREMLDKAGYPDCKICVSNSLDEYIIRDMIMQGAKVDSFGVGERLITSSSSPVFGGVYKIVATFDDGTMNPKIKISENVAKITTPCMKKIYRLFDRESNKAMADVLTVYNEEIDDTKPYEIFDPEYTWKRKIIHNFKAVNLHVKLFENGRPCYKLPDIEQTRDYCHEQMETLWAEVKRFENPHHYYVDLSEKLWKVKRDLLNKYQNCT